MHSELLSLISVDCSGVELCNGSHLLLLPLLHVCGEGHREGAYVTTGTCVPLLANMQCPSVSTPSCQGGGAISTHLTILT